MQQPMGGHIVTVGVSFVVFGIVAVDVVRLGRRIGLIDAMVSVPASSTHGIGLVVVVAVVVVTVVVVVGDGC